MGKYVWPCPKYSRISSKYGNRVHPISGGVKFHDGIDLAAAKGTDIVACAAGTVTKAVKSSKGYGWCLYIEHANGMLSFYAHCSAFYVKKGDRVSAGQRIAAVGTTGASTGNHLHFGMKQNGKSVNPQNYVKTTDTLKNYAGDTPSSSPKNVVNALFTAYYPADNAMEGGFYDAQGKLLDPKKKTCAAPKSIPFGTKITVQGTGTACDGVTYTVTDRGGAIKIVKGVYHFDLLMSTNAECNRFGRRNGTAVIGSTGGSGSAGSSSSSAKSSTGNTSGTKKPAKKDITKTVVKSISGAAGTRKETLHNVPDYQKNGAEILIQNNDGQIQYPAIEGDIVWETVRRGSPGTLKFTTVKDGTLNYDEGNPVSFRFNGQPVFYGYVMKKSRSDNTLIDVTCYDQLRYFKNKDTLAYENKTYTELLKMLAADYGLQCGTLEDTGYLIPWRIEEAAVFDILGNASDLTVISTGKLFVLYDDFGKLTLRHIESMLLPILIDESTGQSFSYTSSIDSDVYNRIKLAYDNEETGERELYVTNDAESQSRRGVLQYYDKLQSAMSSAERKAKAEILLKYYSPKRRELTVRKIFGDIRARAGASVAVKMNLGDIITSNYMVIEKATHTFSHGLHTMDLRLAGVRGEFRA